MGNKREPFEAKKVYHVYNHGNGEDNIFREEDNYHYFLKKYAHYIYPVAKTYAFCLLPNHFHLMMEIREREKLIGFFYGENPQGLPNPEGLSAKNLSNKISHQFGTFLNSYVKSFNSYYNRQGSLIKNTTKRKSIANDSYYIQLIYYIHNNPVKHGLVKSASHWPYSSYHLFTVDKKTKLEKKHALNWFGGKNAFVEYHRKNHKINPTLFY